MNIHIRNARSRLYIVRDYNKAQNYWSALPFFPEVVPGQFYVLLEHKGVMNLGTVLVLVFVATVFISGCVSQVPGTPDIPAPPPGTGVVTTAPDTLPKVTTPVLKEVAPVNTPHNEVFFLEPVKDYHVGDNITVQGTTILSSGDPLLVEVISSSFGPAPKNTSQAFTGVSGIATVRQGPAGGPNYWSFSFTTDGFKEDTYIVTVSGITIDVRDSASFELKPRLK